MKYLEANRGKRFQFKETFEFSGLYIEIQSTKLPIIVCTVTKIYDKVQLERTALGWSKEFMHIHTCICKYFGAVTVFLLYLSGSFTSGCGM